MSTALRRTFALFAVPAIMIGAVAIPASASATPISGGSLAPSTVSPQSAGIIMSDGRICNPRWGC